MSLVSHAGDHGLPTLLRLAQAFFLALAALRAYLKGHV